MSHIDIYLICFGVITIAIIFYKLFFIKKDSNNSYIKKRLLTDNEFEFFNRLVRALPNYYICPQVSMGALLDAKSNDYDNEKKMRYTFGFKIVDFVIYSKNKEVIAIIELDDRTHDKEKDYARDLMLREAGYKILRFESKKKPKIEEIAKIFSNIK